MVKEIKLRELFDKNKNIVINTDIDGFLSGMILQKYYGCKVVGFSDSKNTVWLSPEIKDIDSPVYIDIYVARPNVTCIDQHIIAYDKNHHDEIVSYGNKLNPNLLRERTFVGDMESDYFHKYPFGTVHFLMALMAQEGITVDLPDLSAEHIFNENGISYSTSAGHVLLRADDALNSTLSPYRPNALDWWKWLDPNHEYEAIEKMRNFIDSCDSNRSQEYKRNVGSFFRNFLGCSGSDGAFNNVVNAEGHILPKILNYRDIICGIMKMDLDLPLDYVTHKAEYCIDRVNSSNTPGILHESALYSYAFIFGPYSRKENFSYTVNMS